MMTSKVAEERLMANALRALAMDAVQQANSGHPGMPMGMADIAAVLFRHFVRIDPSCPDWPDRDRFILSAGHGSMLLYALHHLLGFEDMEIGQLRNFRQLGSRTAGHPEYGHAKGIETTTGPLGQGLANAVGMALAERMHNARFGDELVDHYTYVLAGDGCLMEGLSHEAIDLAGHLSLSRLIVLWDDNGITIDGSTSLSTSCDQLARFAACGWHTGAVDGHDPEAIAVAIEQARSDPRPSMIACRTIIGYGAPGKQGTAATHGAPLGAEEIAAARQQLDWPHPPFEIPQSVYTAWQRIAETGATARQAWEKRLEAAPQSALFRASLGAPDKLALGAAIVKHKEKLTMEAPNMATRKASQLALEQIGPVLPNLLGGSADLTGSNNTRIQSMRPVARSDYGGNYLYYGIREHGMAAAMNGIALHGGFIPYGGTFLVFSDYCRGSIRLSALMGLGVTYVMTHDSIGLGEDGPTHQPVEHIASLRAMPNLQVIRPCDAVETAEAWEVALTSGAIPAILCLSRQGLPTLRTRHDKNNLLSRGAYILGCIDTERDLTLIASGSEVAIAFEAARKLSASGIRAAIVSAPCFELFASQDAGYRQKILGTVPRIGIEAAIRQGWDLMLDSEDDFIGMTSFGASAPAADLYEHFGITADAVVQAALNRLKQG